MKLVKESLNEFVRGEDPFKSLGIGIINIPREFTTVNEFVEFIIKYSNTIFNGPIPKDALQPSSGIISKSCFLTICKFFAKYENFTFLGVDYKGDMTMLTGRDSNDRGWASWVGKFFVKLEELGFKQTRN